MQAINFNDCAICMDHLPLKVTNEEQSTNDTQDQPPILETITLICQHTFHKACIDPWFQTANTCPLCRRVVTDISPTGTSLIDAHDNAMALQGPSERLRNNRETVLAAVRMNGRALQYASEELRNNREIVLAAVRT